MAPMRDDFDREILDIIPERFDADADSRIARKNARTRVLVTVSLAVLAIMALGVAARHILFGEAPRDRSLSVPVIHAEDKPIKVRPQDRGGMEVPNQDKLIYDQMAAKGPQQPAERLLPPPEQAQTPPTPAPAPVEQKPAASEAMPPKPAVTAAAPMPAPMPAPTPVAPTPKPAAAAPIKPVPVPPPSPPAPKVAAGGWVVQLGAVGSEAQAHAEWTRLSASHKEQLSGLSPDIVRVDLGAKGIFWRVRGGPLDEAQARMLCAELAKQSQGCIVARK